MRCLAATNKRRDDQSGDGDEADKNDDEERVVAPEHHRRERQRQDAGDDGERERVDEVLEPRGEAQRALGQRTGEVVVEEGRVLGKQLVHADHVQALDPAAVRAVQAVHAGAPQDLRQQHQAGEAEHIGQHRRHSGVRTAGQSARQLGNDQRSEVEQADVSQRRQQQRGDGDPSEA